MNLYLSDGKAKMWRKKGTANDPKHTASSVKHGVVAWLFLEQALSTLLMTECMMTVAE